MNNRLSTFHANLVKAAPDAVIAFAHTLLHGYADLPIEGLEAFRDDLAKNTHHLPLVTILRKSDAAKKLEHPLAILTMASDPKAVHIGLVGMLLGEFGGLNGLSDEAARLDEVFSEAADDLNTNLNSIRARTAAEREADAETTMETFVTDGLKVHTLNVSITPDGEVVGEFPEEVPEKLRELIRSYARKVVKEN